MPQKRQKKQRTSEEEISQEEEISEEEDMLDDDDDSSTDLPTETVKKSYPKRTRPQRSPPAQTSKSNVSKLDQKRIERSFRSKLKILLDSKMIDVMDSMKAYASKSRGRTLQKMPSKVIPFQPPNCIFDTCTAVLNTVDDMIDHGKCDVHDLALIFPDLEIEDMACSFTVPNNRAVFEDQVFGVDFIFGTRNLIKERLDSSRVMPAAQGNQQDPVTPASLKQLQKRQERIFRAKVKELLEEKLIEATGTMQPYEFQARGRSLKKIPDHVLPFNPPRCLVDGCSSEVSTVEQMIDHGKFHSHDLALIFPDADVKEMTSTFTVPNNRAVFENQVFGVDLLFGTSNLVVEREEQPRSRGRSRKAVSKAMYPEQRLLYEYEPITQRQLQLEIKPHTLIKEEQIISQYITRTLMQINDSVVARFAHLRISESKLVCNTGLGAIHAVDTHHSRPLVAVGGFASLDHHSLFCAESGYRNSIQIYSMTTGQVELIILHEFGTVWDLKWCKSDERVLAACFGTGNFCLYCLPDLPMGSIIHLEPAFSMGSAGWWKLAWSPDCKTVALGGFDGTVGIFNVSKQLLTGQYQAHDSAIRQLVFLDENVFCSCGNDGRLMLRDTRDVYTGIQLFRTGRKTINNAVPMYSIDYSKRERVMLLQDAEMTRVMPRDTFPEQATQRFSTHDSLVVSCSCSDMIPFSASASLDGSVLLSNLFSVGVKKGREICCLFQVVGQGFNEIDDRIAIKKRGYNLNNSLIEGDVLIKLCWGRVGAEFRLACGLSNGMLRIEDCLRNSN